MISKKQFISCVKLIDSRLWISTLGCGLFVYNANSLKFEQSWGDKEGREVYNLLSFVAKDGSVIVIALSKDGLFSFANKDMKFLCYQKNAFQKHTMNVGIVIEAGFNIKETELWVCSHTEKVFFILNPYSLAMMEEVKYSQLSKSVSAEQLRHHDLSHNVVSPFMLTSIKHLQAIKVNKRKKIGMAYNWMLYVWDVETRSEQQNLDIMEYCEKIKKSFSCKLGYHLFLLLMHALGVCFYYYPTHACAAGLK